MLAVLPELALNVICFIAVVGMVVMFLVGCLGIIGLVQGMRELDKNRGGIDDDDYKA